MQGESALPEFRFPVEAGHVLTFARAIGDSSASQLEALTSGTDAAGAESPAPAIPPTFLQGGAHFNPESPLRPRPGAPWIADVGGTDEADSGKGSGGGGMLHAEQSFEYRRPVRPGEVLHVSTRLGETWTKEGKRGGRLTFSEQITEYRDPAGAVVVIARSVGVRTERAATEAESK